MLVVDLECNAVLKGSRSYTATYPKARDLFSFEEVGKTAMEVLFRTSPPTMVAVAVVVCVFGMMLPEVSGVRWIVGGNMGWTTGVNYTIWAQDKHFYNGDWLFFVYDRNQMNVLEVNETDYETCNSTNPIHNWTTGAGRDVVPLNVTRPYYYISGKGFCYGGMKVAINVENLPPTPSPSPLNLNSSAPTMTYGLTPLVLPMALAAGVIWEALFPL